MTDLYADLEVARDADEAAIKSAYRRLAKTHHPDAGGDRDAFERIERAHRVLSDADKRRRYDETGAFEEGPHNIEAMAFQIIEVAVTNFLESPFEVAGTLLDNIRGMLSDGLDGQGKQAKLSKRRIAQMEKERDRTFIIKGREILRPMIERRIASQKRTLAAQEKQLEAISHALKLLENHAVVGEADFTGSFKSTTSATTTRKDWA